MRLSHIFQGLALIAPALAIPSDQFTTLVDLDSGEKPPQLTLQPAIHWNTTTNQRKNIRANKKQDLYYASGSVTPDTEHHFGRTAVTYKLPAVNIDYDDNVNIDEVADKVSVAFNDKESYDIAQDSWSNYDELLLLTYSDICEDHAKGDYCYVLAKNFTFDSDTNTASASADVVDPVDYIFAVDFEWGLYEPANKAPRGSLRKRQADSTTEACSAVADNGLPIATLGPRFDKRLDDCRGYEKLSDTEYSGYVRSVGGDQSAQDVVTDDDKTMSGNRYLMNKTEAKDIADSAAQSQTDNPAERRDLHLFTKRGWLSWFPIKIPGINKPITKDWSKKFDWSVPKDRGNAAGPWKKAKLLKKWEKQKTTGGNGKGAGGTKADGTVSVYCVDCGASGSLHIYGKASWQLDSGFKEGIVVATVNLNIGFALGLDVQGTLKSSHKKEIAHVGLPGLSFGIITVGPWIELGADFTLTANAEGRLLAGARFIIQNAKSTLDFAGKGRTGSSGWTPQFEPIFEASGQVAVAAEVGLPIGLTVGLNILKGRFKWGVGVVERPSLEAKAEFAATADTTGASIVKTDGCAGVATQINFKNEVFADILGKKLSLITPYVKTLTKGCIKIGQAASSKFTTIDGALPPMIAAAESVTNNKFNGYNTTSENGTEYTMLVDSTKEFFLMSCPDNNVYLRPRTEAKNTANLTCSRVFQTAKNSVVGDGIARLFHYYKDSMDTLGVSRLRVHADDSIPKGNDAINFYAFSNNTGSLEADANVNDDPKGTKAYYIAQNRNGDRFYAVLCSFENPEQYPAKMFLAKDPERGPEILMQENVQMSVTGAKALSCSTMPFMQAPAEKGNDWNNQWSADQTPSEGVTTDAEATTPAA